MWIGLKFVDVDWICRIIQSNPIHTEPYLGIEENGAMHTPTKMGHNGDSGTPELKIIGEN
jgi:hypothetical protein